MVRPVAERTGGDWWSFRWWFENRETGQITIAQFPNWPLFAIGAVHALFYDGDILMLYAELGLGLLLVRRPPTRGLLLLALGLLPVFPVTRPLLPPVSPTEEEDGLPVA